MGIQPPATFLSGLQRKKNQHLSVSLPKKILSLLAGTRPRCFLLLGVAAEGHEPCRRGLCNIQKNSSKKTSAHFFLDPVLDASLIRNLRAKCPLLEDS